MTTNENVLTQEQCGALVSLITALLRVKRLEMTCYYHNECLSDAMSKLEGAGYAITLTRPTQKDAA